MAGPNIAGIGGGGFGGGLSTSGTQNLTPGQQTQAKSNLGLLPDTVGVSLVATLTGNTYGSNHSDGSTQNTQDTRIQHIVPQYARSLRLVYGAYNPVATTDVESGPPSANATNYTGAIEYNGVCYQATFGTATGVPGATSVNLNSGQSCISDPVPVDIPAGSTIYSRTHATVVSASAQTIMYTYVTTANDSYSFNVSDKTLTPGALGTTSALNFAVGPIAILGATYPNQAYGVLIQGDSIGYGLGDSSGARLGYIQRALTAGNIPFSNQSAGGTTLATRVVGNNTIQRQIYWNGQKYVICQLGTNDAQAGTSLATMQSLATTLWNFFAARGAKVYATTLLPVSGSTDQWRTTTNQTPSQGAAHAAYNTWIRTTPAPLSGFFDPAALIETNIAGVLTLNGGYWSPPAVLTSTSGTATAGTTLSLTDSGASWTVNQWAGFTCYLTSGTGSGFAGAIASNTATVLTISPIFRFGSTAGVGTGYFISNCYTIDGTHPTAASSVILQAAVNTGLFV